MSAKSVLIVQTAPLETLKYLKSPPTPNIAKEKNFPKILNGERTSRHLSCLLVVPLHLCPAPSFYSLFSLISCSPPPPPASPPYPLCPPALVFLRPVLLFPPTWMRGSLLAFCSQSPPFLSLPLSPLGCPGQVGRESTGDDSRTGVRTGGDSATALCFGEGPGGSGSGAWSPGWH